MVTVMVTTTIMITAIIIEPLIRQHEAHRIMATGALPDSATQPDVSPLVDTGPARAPQAVVLEGRFGRVEKLEPSRHHADLWAGLAGQDQIWTYLPYGPFADATAFEQWLVTRAATTDPFSYAVIDRTGRALGIVTLMSVRPDMRVIEVGHILLSPALQRTPLATEAQYLIASYVFETLGYRRYEWKCNVQNAASRRAAERFGFSFEGVFRQHMIVKGRNRDTAWYAMLDSDWPSRKAAFERWLAPENFDAEGRQKARLSEARS
ncbi:MAG TPA: GNAT family protein [Xanthobacteraceae bacterium]